MKKIIILIFSFLIFGQITFSQNRTLPNVTLKTLDGKNINIQDIENDGKPIVICFWATWCKPCVLELNNIADVYEEWQEETGVKIVAVSIDNSRSVSRVKPRVEANGWDYEILLDVNSDLKRAMGVGNPPYTFLLNSKKEIIYVHNGYMEGDEDELYEKIKKM